MGVVGATVVTLAKAIAHRLSGRVPSAEMRREVQLLRDEVEQLRGELDAVHGRLAELDEVQGRLDFAERMLSQGKDKNALPGAR